jgi:hypothetical protein
MRLYLDEDIASRELTSALIKAGHDVSTPGDFGLLGRSDSLQMTQAVRDDRVCLTRNSHDFEDLHDLILLSGGSHPGIFTMGNENNPRRDMKPGNIVKAIKNLSAVVASFRDHVICLND